MPASEGSPRPLATADQRAAELGARLCLLAKVCSRRYIAMATRCRAGHALIQRSESQLTLCGVAYPRGSRGLISITSVAKTSFTKA